jgi:hypothetical protein
MFTQRILAPMKHPHNVNDGPEIAILRKDITWEAKEYLLLLTRLARLRAIIREGEKPTWRARA